MFIRSATLTDVGTLADLHCEFRDSLQKVTPTREQFHETLLKLLQQSGTRALVAYVDTEAAGYVTLQARLTAWASTNVAVLEDLYVRQSFRGRGIGRLLVQAAIEEARALGCSAISLDTNEKNEASQKIYRTLGFTCERARWAGGRQIRYDIHLAA